LPADGNPVDCAGESALYFELQAIKQQIQQAIDAISSGTAPGSGIAETNMCRLH
jgi:hypothetical protein